MFNSKALKNFDTPKHSKLYSWWLESKLVDWYYRVSWDYFGKHWNTLKKVWGWYRNVLRYDFDFDAHSLFAIIEYKLKRIEKSLIKGTAYQEPKDMKALRIAIKLAGRLKDDVYSELFHNRHERKWGQSKHWFEPVGDGSGNSYMRSSRPKVNTEEEKKQERAEYMAMIHRMDAKEKSEQKILFDIINNHLRVWWD